MPVSPQLDSFPSWCRCQKTLALILLSPRLPMHGAAEDAYLSTDQDYVDLDTESRQDDGTTAVTAVLVGQRLIMAHVGDSRAVLCEGGVGALAETACVPARRVRGRLACCLGGDDWLMMVRVTGTKQSCGVCPLQRVCPLLHLRTAVVCALQAH